MNHYEKDKESSFLMYWDANNYMDGNVSLANNFGLENIKFWWEFYKNYNENNDKGCILEVGVEYLKTIIWFT